IVDGRQVVLEPVERGTNLGVIGERGRLRVGPGGRRAMSVGGCRANGHSAQYNAKQKAIHDLARIRVTNQLSKGQLRAGWEAAGSEMRARTSASVRTRADCLAASKMRLTVASSAVLPCFSSQKSTLDLPLIGPISMTWSRPKRWEGTPE